MCRPIVPLFMSLKRCTHRNVNNSSNNNNYNKSILTVSKLIIIILEGK